MYLLKKFYDLIFSVEYIKLAIFHFLSYRIPNQWFGFLQFKHPTIFGFITLLFQLEMPACVKFLQSFFKHFAQKFFQSWMFFYSITVASLLGWKTVRKVRQRFRKSAVLLLKAVLFQLAITVRHFLVKMKNFKCIIGALSFLQFSFFLIFWRAISYFYSSNILECKCALFFLTPREVVVISVFTVYFLSKGIKLSWNNFSHVDTCFVYLIFSKHLFHIACFSIFQNFE